MKIRAVAVGSLSLIALQVVVTSPQTGRLAELLALPASWARWLIDANVPGIPDLSGTSTTPTAASTASTIV
jgi:hypothetical protein